MSILCPILPLSEKKQKVIFYPFSFPQAALLQQGVSTGLRPRSSQHKYPARQVGGYKIQTSIEKNKYKTLKRYSPNKKLQYLNFLWETETMGFRVITKCARSAVFRRLSVLIKGRLRSMRWIIIQNFIHLILFRHLWYSLQENWAKLREVYQKVEEVDLYVGGLSETPVAGEKNFL